MASHKTDWILSELPLPTCSVLSFILLVKLSNECTWLIDWLFLSLQNFHKRKHFVYIILYSCRVVVACLLVYSLFYIALLLLSAYFFIPLFNTDVIANFFIRWWLSIEWTMKSIVFGFSAFVYHLQNTISIFITIFSLFHPVLFLYLSQRFNHELSFNKWIHWIYNPTGDYKLRYDRRNRTSFYCL